MPRSVKSSSGASVRSHRHRSGEIPAASEEWFDAFTSDDRPSSSSSSSSKRPANYRPNKFNTADLIRNIKEVNDQNSNSASSKHKSQYDIYRSIISFLQRTPTATLIQMVIVFVASGILLDKMVSMTSGYGPKKAAPVNSIARINYGDSLPNQQQQQMQMQQQQQLMFQDQQHQQQDQQMLRHPQQPNFNTKTNGNSPPNMITNTNTDTNPNTDPNAIEHLKELEKSEYDRNANKDRIPKSTKTKSKPSSPESESTPKQTGFVPGQLYYNNGSPTPIPLTYEHHPAGGPAISILVTNREKDISELRTALRSLAFLQGDLDPDHKAPILIFNEGDLSPEQIESIVTSCPDRPIAFPTVDFTEFPPGYNGEQEGTKFQVKGRKEWGYYHMIRFWVTGIWKHPAIDHFETIMRIDSDSCFKEINPYLPNFMNDDLYYHSQYVGFENGAQYVHGLYDFAVNYMQTVRIPSEPRNFLLWHFSTTVWTTMDTLPLFRTNFEVSRVSFMKRNDVSLWHDALTDKAPHGVYRYRWGDAVTRFLTASMFENQDRIMTIRPTGYFHKIGCSAEEVDEALKTLSQE